MAYAIAEESAEHEFVLRVDKRGVKPLATSMPFSIDWKRLRLGEADARRLLVEIEALWQTYEALNPAEASEYLLGLNLVEIPNWMVERLPARR